MRPSRVRQKWNASKPALSVVSALTDPSVAEMMSLMGFDCIWIDLEHHPTSVETAGQIMRAARVGAADILARPGKGEFMRLGRLMECGAQGIMYPRCDNAAEAREVVRWSRFAPLGERGLDGGNPDMPYCSMDIGKYIKEANEQTFVMVQIESPAAVEHVREIAEIPGIDMIFFGPADYSVLSGKPGLFTDPAVVAACERVCRDAIAGGNRFGTIAFNPEMGKRLIDMGASLLCHGTDIVMIKQHLERIRNSFGALGFTFDDRLSGGASAYAATR
jgi:4-hydroxy-2-oxoheptanedioate aldolase